MKDKVEYQIAKEVHDYEHKHHFGPGAGIIAAVGIIASLATWGAGASILGTTSGLTTAAANAAFSAFASSAAINFITCDGDLGKAFKNTFSDKVAKKVLFAAITAGICHQVLAGIGIDGNMAEHMPEANAAHALNDQVNVAQYAAELAQQAGVNAGGFCYNLPELMQNIVEHGIRGVVGAGMNDLAGEDHTWKNILRNCAANVVGQWGAGQIGDMYLDPQSIFHNPVVHKLAHGIVGALSGSLMGGTGCVMSGAVGAMIGHGLCEHLLHQGVSPEEAAKISKIMSTLSGIPIGHNVNAAYATAANAIDYNCLAHLEEDDEAEAVDDDENELIDNLTANPSTRTGPMDDDEDFLQHQHREGLLADVHEAELAVLLGMEGSATSQAFKDRFLIRPPSPTNMETRVQRIKANITEGVYNKLPEQVKQFLAIAQEIATLPTPEPEGVLGIIEREANMLTQLKRLGEGLDTGLSYMKSGARRSLRAAGVEADLAQDLVSVCDGVLTVGGLVAGGRALTREMVHAELSGMRTMHFEGAALNQQPYHPRRMEAHLEAGLTQGETMTSSTLLKPNERMVHMAGKRHPVTGVVYDQRGYPVFDEFAVFDVKLPTDVALSVQSNTHKTMATKELAKVIKDNPQLRVRFTEAQMQDILNGRKSIDGYIWHHHQDVGRMQLIPEVLHEKTGHVGQNLWRRGVTNAQE